MDQRQVSEAFTEICDRLAAEGEKNRFRLNTYKKMACLVRTLPNFESLTMTDLTAIKGVGEAMAEKVLTFRNRGKHKFLDELRKRTEIKPRIARERFEEIVLPVQSKMQEQFPEAEVIIAGSYRREETVFKDADILVIGDENPSVYVSFFQTLGERMDAGKKKSTSVEIEGLQIDLRIVERECREMGLLWFTGPGSFAARTRAEAKKRGFKLNEKGLFDRETEELITRSEREVLEKIDIGWLEPAERY